MASLKIMEKLDRAAIAASLFSPTDNPVYLEVIIERPHTQDPNLPDEIPIRPLHAVLIKVTGLEQEDGSGFLFNVEGQYKRSRGQVKLFLNCNPKHESAGCLLITPHPH